MLFDANLIFWGASPYQSVSNYATLVTATTTASGVVNIVNPADLGIGDGEAVPKIAAYIGTAVTSASASLTLTFKFQGSTDSSNWTTYIESQAYTTASLVAGAKVMAWDLPHRPAGASLPQYYRVAATVGGTNGTDTISSGSIFAGIVIQRNDNPVGMYSSGFTVV